MEKIFLIIKIWASIQFLIILLLILLFTITRLIIIYGIKKRKEKMNKIRHLLNEINDNPHLLTPAVIHFFKRSISEFILCLADLDLKNKDNINWYRTKTMLSNHILKNKYKKLSSSINWFKRYLAIRCYQLGFDIEDDKTLLRLVKDDNLIISINAATYIFNSPNLNPKSINEVVDTLSKRRRIMQDTYANILTNNLTQNIKAIRDVLLTRLQEEKKLFVRILSYRILNHLKPTDKIDSFVENDLLSEKLDLKIVALKYVTHINAKKSKSILLIYLNDASYEVRTTVVKLLGETGDKSVIPYLKDKLNDPVWWVRINAAYSLIKFDPEGFAILEEISPKNGKFAYETAQAFLKIYERKKIHEHVEEV